jgi:hypothetical protein
MIRVHGEVSRCPRCDRAVVWLEMSSLVSRPLAAHDFDVHPPRLHRLACSPVKPPVGQRASDDVQLELFPYTRC